MPLSPATWSHAPEPPAMDRVVEKHRPSAPLATLDLLDLVDSRHELDAIDEFNADGVRLVNRVLIEARQGHKGPRARGKPFLCERSDELTDLVDRDPLDRPAFALDETPIGSPSEFEIDIS